MTQLDLSLPEAPKRTSSKGPIVLLVILQLAILGGVIALFLMQRSEDSGPSFGKALRSAERLQDLAIELEKQTLWSAAADAWKDYLEVAAIDDGATARIVYRRGLNLEKAGRSSEAARCFAAVTRQKGSGLELPSEERREAHRHLLECLSVLGKEEARERALEAFVVPDAQPTGTVVAQVGSDKISLEDLRTELIDQLAQTRRIYEPDLSPSDARQQAREQAERALGDAQGLARALQEKVSAEVLYRDGLARGFGSGADYERTMARFRRQYIASKVIDDLSARLAESVGESDIESWFKAHPDDFRAPEAVQFAWQRHATKAASDEALAALADSESTSLAATGFNAASAPALRGRPLPDVGASPEANALLFALEPGEISTRPVEIDGTWFLLQSISRTPERALTLAEARDDVRRAVLAAKRQESLEKLQTQLAETYRVQVFEDAIQRATGDLGKPESAGSSEGEAEAVDQATKPVDPSDQVETESDAPPGS